MKKCKAKQERKLIVNFNLNGNKKKTKKKSNIKSDPKLKNIKKT